MLENREFFPNLPHTNGLYNRNYNSHLIIVYVLYKYTMLMLKASFIIRQKGGNSVE